MGTFFKGVYNLYDSSLNLFRPSQQKLLNDYITISNIEDREVDQLIGTTEASKLREDVELLSGVYPDFNTQEYLDGELAPVFFGSAVNNFGVQELLDTFIRIAPNPKGRESSTRMVAPTEKDFSGFVFKIHANLDPKHRDRIAFLRVCSGKFERNKQYHHVRHNKDMRFNNPTNFMASQKSVIQEAFPGDVIGLYDSGNFKIGDTMTEGEKFMFKGIPSFSPEIFKEIINTDPMKTKQLNKGLEQLTDEGVAQLFKSLHGSRNIIGTVGELQFEVIQYRLLHEYAASCRMSPVNYFKACWMTSDHKAKMDEFIKFKSNNIFIDKDDNYVYMAESQWMLDVAIKDFPEITFHSNSEFKV
jgi:peptide chain release factor 3